MIAVQTTTSEVMAADCEAYSFSSGLLTTISKGMDADKPATVDRAVAEAPLLFKMYFSIKISGKAPMR